MVLLAFHVGMNVADADPGDGAVWRHAIPENSRQVATSAFAACRRFFVVPLSGRENGEAKIQRLTTAEVIFERIGITREKAFSGR